MSQNRVSDTIMHVTLNTLNNALVNEQGESTNTLFCLISVSQHLELCVAIILYRHYCFYQLSYIIFFGVHSSYLCDLGKN